MAEEFRDIDLDPPTAWFFLSLKDAGYKVMMTSISELSNKLDSNKLSLFLTANPWTVLRGAPNGKVMTVFIDTAQFGAFTGPTTKVTNYPHPYAKTSGNCLALRPLCNRQGVTPVVFSVRVQNGQEDSSTMWKTEGIGHIVLFPSVWKSSSFNYHQTFQFCRCGPNVAHSPSQMILQLSIGLRVLYMAAIVDLLLVSCMALNP